MGLKETNIDELPINQRVIDLVKGRGIVKLFPPQEMAFNTKLLKGGNLVLAFPTSSGKTLVAEIAMLKSILDGRGKALYLVPLRALAHEKYADFKKYEKIGITVALSVGDYDSSGTGLKEADIVIMTTEKADSIIRHSVDWLERIGIVVADEIHLVNDISRGPTLEMVIAKLNRLLSDIQVLALSATISNADEIASWLDAELVKSAWRPIPLTEGVFLDGEIIFEDNTSRAIRMRRKEDIADIVCDILEENGQVLVFVSSRRSTVSLSKRIASSIRPYLTSQDMNELHRVSRSLVSSVNVPESTKILSTVLRKGSAFHHAGLKNRERSIIESCFRNNTLKVIIATPTLAAGVNLPARRVIIRDYRRFERGRGSYPIPILEYKQMAGRAGRPAYDEYGEAILVARSEQEKEFLLENYVLSETEAITSKLASPKALRFHLLSTIAAGITRTRERIDNLIEGTFYSHQFEKWEIDHHITSVITFLEDGGLIRNGKGEDLVATPLGERTSRLYIDPYSAILLRDTLGESKEITEIGLLHLICHTPDQPTSYVTRSEFEDYEIMAADYLPDLSIPLPDSWEDPESYTHYLAELKTARLLQDWIDENSEREITENYNVGMGDVHRYVRSAEWLLYSTSEICRVAAINHHIPLIHKLHSRIRHGVKEELLELVGLKGIGRVRARMLHNNGLRNLSDLYKADIQTIGRVPAIGTGIARSIKKQLGFDVGESKAEIASENETLLDESMQTLLEDFE